MIQFWVDDAIFYAKSKKIIDNMILSLKDTFLLEREEDMAGFLETNIIWNAKTITMIQTGLIDRILGVMDMEDSNLKYTPVDTDLLHDDLEG